MKKLLIICLVALTTLASCKKENADNSADTAALALSVNTTVSAGTWRVSYFFDDTDETVDFNGYAFTFNAGGTVNAVKAGNIVTGTWRTGTDDSKAKLYLAFTAPSNSDFLELTEDWHVLERSDTKIRMQHISGGNGGTDYLTLEKN